MRFRRKDLDKVSGGNGLQPSCQCGGGFGHRNGTGADWVECVTIRNRRVA